jgi:hypothetical protein
VLLNRFFRAFACLAVCVFGVGGCAHVHTEWVPTRYLAQLDGRYARDLDTNQCAHACYDGAKGDGDRFYACLATCPNVDVTDESTCDDVTEPPIAFCYTQIRAIEVADPSSESDGAASSDDGGLNFLGALIGAVVEGIAESGSHSGSSGCGECAAESSSGGTSPKPRSERRESKREEPRHVERAEKRVYHPSTPHRTDD